MKRHNLNIILLLAFLFVLTSGTEILAQCAMCKAAAESSLNQNPKSIAHGLNKGILFLMAIPYAAVGFIFRKELKLIIDKLRGKSEEKFDSTNLGRFTFAFSFVTVMVLLFIVFILVH